MLPLGVLQTPEGVAALQHSQLRILRALWPLLREGGKLLYSTCSLLARENDVSGCPTALIKRHGLSAAIYHPRVALLLIPAAALIVIVSCSGCD